MKNLFAPEKEKSTTIFAVVAVVCMLFLLPPVAANAGSVISAIVDLASQVSGVLGFANGGTGLSSLGTAGQALVVNPSVTGMSFSDVGDLSVSPSVDGNAGTLKSYLYRLTGPTKRAITAATDTILYTDGNKIPTCENISGCAITLPSATSTGFTSPFTTTIKNNSGQASTLTSSSLIGNVFSVTLNQGEWLTPTSDSSNYSFLASSSVLGHNRAAETLSPMTALDARMTMSNATGGICSYYGSTGILSYTATGACAPRYTYLPATSTYRGILVESTATNLDVDSRFSSPSYWSGSAVTLSYLTATGPSGASAEATLLTTTATTLSHYTQGKASSVSYTNGSTYTQSAFVKAGTEGVVQLTFPSAAFGSTVYANFNLASLTATGTYISATIKDVGDGWRRVSVTANAIADNTNSPGVIAFTNNNSAATRISSFDGTAGLTLYVAAHQIETGPYATSYVRTMTSGTAATRSADLLQIPTPFWINNKEGTFCAKFNTMYNKAGVVVAGSATQRTLIGLTSTSYGANDGTTSADFNLSQVAAGTDQQACLRWSATSGYMNMAVNGTLGTQVAFDGNMDLGAGLNFGRDYNGSNRVDLAVQSWKAWGYALSDADMATESAP